MVSKVQSRDRGAVPTKHLNDKSKFREQEGWPAGKPERKLFLFPGSHLAAA